MKKNDKIFSMLILSLALLVYLFLFGYDRDQKSLLQVTAASASEVDSEDGILTDYSFEPLVVSEDLVTIEGWALVRGTDSRDVIPTLFLVDEQGNHFKVTTRIIKRKDVTETINDGQTYTNSGFRSTFDPEGLDRDSTYTVLIRMDIDDATYTASTDMQLKLP